MITISDTKRRGEAESQLFEGKANGAKFNLTSNHGWVEKTMVAAYVRAHENSMSMG
jgi:hypothetical protein